VRAEHVSSRVIFKLGDQCVYLNSIGILSTLDPDGYGVRGLTKKELTRVVKGFVEQMDTINEKLNEALVLLDGIDSITVTNILKYVGEKAEVDNGRNASRTPA